MTRPAARIGDQTAHGGVIVSGEPTVLIGGLPAARVGDMHACPLSDGPKPHVGGPVLPPGSPTVLIGGLPAARIGDQAACASAPDVIVMGEPTVLIGESGAGAGGGGAAAAGGEMGPGQDEGSTQAVAATGVTTVAVASSVSQQQVSEPATTEEPQDSEEPEAQETTEPAITHARWVSTRVKCGDPVRLEAQTRNISSGTQATFTIKKISDEATVATIQEPTSASSVRAQWISKKPTDRWDGRAELTFQVSAAGVQADSSNQLGFFEYQDIRGQERVLVRRGVNAAGRTARLRDGKFHAEFKDKKLIITIRIKLLNRTRQRPSDTGADRADDQTVPIGPPLSDAEKRRMSQDIEGFLSEKLKLHRQGCQRGQRCDCNNKCCKFNIELHVRFVESNEHHVVNLWPGRGRADSVNWYRIKTRPNSWAHETGHLLGWFDEYTNATWHGQPPRWHRNRPGAIMNTGRDVPPEYYYDFRDWFAGRTGEGWDLVSP